MGIIIKRLLKIRTFIYPFLIIPLLLLVFYNFTRQHLNYPFYISVSRLHLFFFPILEILLILLFIDFYFHQVSENKQALRERLWLIFAAINLFLLIFLTVFYSQPARTSYESVRLILPFLYFFTLLASLCFLFFFLKVLGNWPDRVERFLFYNQDTNRSIKIFPITLVILGASFLIGIALRLINLDAFPPYIDELSHTHAAIQLIKTGKIVYNRAFLTVSLPVYLSFKLFGIGLWAGRFPMVILNMIAIFPLYRLGKKINGLFAYICVFLFTFSPWIIAISRTIREYAIIPLFAFSTALLLIEVFNSEGLSIQAYLKTNWWRFLLLVGILGYVLIDSKSIIKIILVNYGIAAVQLFFILLTSKIKKSYKIIGFSSIFLILSIFIFSTRMIDRVSEKILFFLNPQNIYWDTSIFWRALTSSNTRQWYSIPQIGYLVLFVSLIIGIVSLYKFKDQKRMTASWLIGGFIIVFLFCTFLLVNDNIPLRMRYGALIEFWYLPLTAMFLVVVFRLINGIIKSKTTAQLLFLLIMLIGFTNYSSITRMLTYKGGGSFFITGEKHYICDPAYEFLLGNVKDGDTILANTFFHYDELNLNQLGDINYLHYFDLLRKQNLTLSQVIQPYDEGWIVLYPNATPQKYGIYFSDFFVAGKKVQYLGTFGEMYIWHWED
jgi:hypothetical protein